MIESILQNNGFNIALSGILVVFAGLILIAWTIHLFNKIFERLHRRPDSNEPTTAYKPLSRFKKKVNISDDELAAIAVAIECYRKLHFDKLQSQITFKHGEPQNAWIIGQRVSTLNK